MRLFLHRLRHDRGLRHLWLAVIAICSTSVVIACVISRTSEKGKTLRERAASLELSGQVDRAEKLYWETLQHGPVDTETLLGFIDAHAALTDGGEGDERNRDQNSGESEDEKKDEGAQTVLVSSVTEKQIVSFLDRRDFNPSVSALGHYWYAVRMVDKKSDTKSIRNLADGAKPVRWANHLLARAALMNDDSPEAARRFEREGLSFPTEAREDLRHALFIWSDNDAWEELRKRRNDSRYAAVIGPAFRLILAEHDRDWFEVIRYVWPAGFEGVKAWPLFLAALSGALWFAIATRMGRIGEGVEGRKGLYAAAFVLGILSVYPTLLLITLEESVFSLRLVGQPIPDAIYFVFGVGLREELCKLLAFLPLLPILWRRRLRIEALTCGALVGLGFAAEENIGYFHRMEIADALGRFLTANFLHMSLTALIAVSAFESSRRAGVRRDTFGTVFPLAVFLHGAYDFVLESRETAGFSFLAMGVFILLSRQFLREMMSTCPAQRQRSVLRTFVISLVILTGVSYIYATTLVGAVQGLAVIGSGLLGVAIMIYMFVRELAY
ncbi:MAG TPA: PrsW family glutamic-type intramembrane protease [Thermoanaerobaculia bacterium]|nr:PrsW family glutamic-type intramembrane protease [Thermoanaerobaculia bacterium]